MSFHHRRIAITGMGAVTPIGCGVEEFWRALRAGESGVRHVRNPALQPFGVCIGGEVDLPPGASGLPPKMERRLGRHIILGVAAANEAIAHAGFTPSDVARAGHRMGAIFGTGDAGDGLHYQMSQRIAEGTLDSAGPFYVVGVIPGTPPALFAKQHGLRGPNFAVSSACASSNHAFGVAAALIRTGQADVIFAGGTEGVVDVPAMAGFGVIGALSRRTADPAAASRPFDAERDGFVLAEGAGVLCLEAWDHAVARGATIHAELRGTAFTCDAHDMVKPHPDGEGAQRAMREALCDAGLGPADIHLINAHGTSTPLGDLAESRALHAIFGQGGGGIPVHSTKSMTGHLIGAAGAVEAIASILAIARGVVHPSINVDTPDPALDLNVVRQAMQAPVAHVLSNNFAFGGQNATIILSHPDA
ncbi:MAG: beta-ketoacyl-[acyl-carrier-protein] synthase family protein [Gemmatimonadetes bacterium]|nr:beta-ketoacyl-[acyl-carrier-protein] synthase family protein [Gemmatimonadota bacterium]